MMTKEPVMGRLGWPQVTTLLQHLRNRFGLTTLIETGTYIGESTAVAAKIFEHVITIDNAPMMQAAATCQEYDNITFLHGDSRELLPAVIDQLTGPAMFYLDGHLISDCPVLDELDSINSSHFQHCVLIDDLWAFASPENKTWPSVAEIMAKTAGYLTKSSQDTIILAPNEASDILEDFVRTMIMPPAFFMPQDARLAMTALFDATNKINAGQINDF